MDFLEHTAVNDVIVLGVVLEEVKHKNQSVYQRLRTLCASEERRFYVFSNEHHKCDITPVPPVTTSRMESSVIALRVTGQGNRHTAALTGCVSLAGHAPDIVLLDMPPVPHHDSFWGAGAAP